MRVDSHTLLAILIMAGVTFACRAGGYLVLRRVHPGPWLRHFLGHLPGVIFVAYVAPLIVAGGPPDWAGGLATLLAVRISGNVTAGIGAGIAAFALTGRLLDLIGGGGR